MPQIVSGRRALASRGMHLTLTPAGGLGLAIGLSILFWVALAAVLYLGII